ncbi:hypothetical protein HR45_05840 [Shewanella mangrovi]|uniref:DUF3010 domain-containing protein n=1 Tax=Shewanella mangrovi TaxID=1515746 RepID=A0A094JDP0_9GAMM|nr:DUF3010 family protein [Shewanella mangrovi]KFZ38030.1 hypothetical protein HR45_05840 [Shewanella mangrovi]
MKVCGVEINSSEAIICMVQEDGEMFNVPECRSRSISLRNASDDKAIQEFHFAFKKLMQDYKVDEIVIISRPLKGKFAGSAGSFKMEAAIQLCDLPATLIQQTEVKEQLKLNPLQVDFEYLELRRIQKPAFEAAYAYLNIKRYSKD